MIVRRFATIFPSRFVVPERVVVPENVLFPVMVCGDAVNFTTAESNALAVICVCRLLDAPSRYPNSVGVIVRAFATISPVNVVVPVIFVAPDIVIFVFDMVVVNDPTFILSVPAAFSTRKLSF